MEDNLNDTPSNMKIKTITSDTYREEFEVNTIAHHPDTNTWWVIKSDTSTYLQNGEYEHEIELVELLEFYSYRHLPNCAFAPNTYSLEQMLNRLFYIGKQIDLSVTYPSFLDKDRQMPFMSFENFTIANAIKNIARAINAIPKVVASVSGGEIGVYIQDISLTFINRSGNETTIVEGLDTQFPVAFEKNANSSDQFLTRSISNLSNAKSSELVLSPKKGGHKNISPNVIEYNVDTARVFLPSKIDKVEYINIFPKMKVNLLVEPGSFTTTIYEGYYLDREDWRQKIINSTVGSYTTAQRIAIANNLPEVEAFHKVLFNQEIDKNFLSTSSNLFFKKMTIKSKFDFDTTDSQDTKDRTIHWAPNTNEIVMPLSFRNGLQNNLDHNQTFLLEGGTFERVEFQTVRRDSGWFINKVPNDEVLIQVAYYPIADIKVSYDNDNDAQDEKFFNQSGKVIDSFSTTQLIISHTNDSVEGTKIRNAKYTSYNSILPLGQIVRDNNQLYIVAQRSIDLMMFNGNNYFNVVYTLSRNRIARSENIQADSAVINYQTPENDLVYRSQLYKDYIELSLTDGNKDIPYLPMTKALVFESNFVGTNFDYTVLAKNTYDTSTIYYIQNPTIFTLSKAKLFTLNWQDNNILGFRLDSTGSTFVQTPILYTNNVGKATDFELLVLDTNNLKEAVQDYNSPVVNDSLVPFSDLTQVPTSFYEEDVLLDGRYSIRIQEPNYDKDSFEIPVFSYMIQGNDNYDQKGNVVIGNDLFTSYSKTSIDYNYVISTTRFTAENANRLFSTLSPTPSSSIQRVIITKTNETTINIKLFSTLVSTTPPIQLNTTSIQGKHIGIFAVGNDSTRKFLFAINDYNMQSNNDINLYINNWKI
jgi:hypothetical protein